MFEDLMREKIDERGRKKYAKAFGWKEQDADGDMIPAGCFVIDTHYGFNVLRQGANLVHLFWDMNLDAAVEWAVDYSRREIAAHEFKEQRS